MLLWDTSSTYLLLRLSLSCCQGVSYSITASWMAFPLKMLLSYGWLLAILLWLQNHITIFIHSSIYCHCHGQSGFRSYPGNTGNNSPWMRSQSTIHKFTPGVNLGQLIGLPACFCTVRRKPEYPTQTQEKDVKLLTSSNLSSETVLELWGCNTTCYTIVPPNTFLLSCLSGTHCLVNLLSYVYIIRW